MNKTKSPRTIRFLRSRLAGLPLVLAGALVLLLSMAPSVRGQIDIAQYFKQNCANCHWIGGGRLVGPDLKNVSQRQDRNWMIRFILDPKSMLDAQDPVAMKLKDESNGALMTNVPGITRANVEALLDFIDAESALDSSQFFGTPKALEPFSDSVAALGLEIFAGRKMLAKGGPACVSCHSVNASGSGLGGQLGPDLTGIFGRLNGRTALQAWLSSPATETMRSVFKGHELDADETRELAMFFESVSGQAEYDPDTFIIWLAVVVCGLGGGIFGMVAFGGIWSKRFRAVRRPLITESIKKR
ncbi:MAG: cytochrome c [candidate division Zixibacteria bacterium]|nr:cytochrome c [candidate division Zixibacteria bacterium]MDH3938197.1 cytochrome c [candidate division Zixibacteria bacterium]